MKRRCMIILLLVLTCIPATSFSQNFSDYLILQDILPYKLEAPQKVVGGYIGGPRVFDGAGVIAPTGHFYLDHSDKTYEAYYEGGNTLPSPTVQVTQHAGSDSDKWLMHEVERGFRSDDLESQFEGTIKEIEGNKIFAWLYGTSYRWVSNNVVVYISYSDPQLSKPEPLEIVQAYLRKFPSTITLTDTKIKSKAHNEKWIKDEMERRLWLCDKWFFQLQLQKAEIEKVLQESVDHMKVFLDYRERYYGISATEDKKPLWGYLQAKDGTGIKNKLKEYKDWWKKNKNKNKNKDKDKDKAISL